MISEDTLKDLLAKQELARKDKLLLVLGAEGGKPKNITAIKGIASACGLRRIKGWNISSILGRGEPHAIYGNKGWELTTDGKKRVSAMTGIPIGATTTKVAVDLRACLASIKDTDTVNFLDEAVACLEGKLLRAAVVLSWVGAVSVLYKYVAKNALAAFNAEALRRNPKWKSAKTEDDLALMGEHDFLDVLESISVIGKSVKQELQTSLTLRNACGHPNSYKLGPSRVAAHVECLILNVFQKF